MAEQEQAKESASPPESQTLTDEAGRVVEFVKTEDYFELYVTIVQIGVNFLDIRLLLGDLSKTGENSFEFEHEMTVVMSPELAKQLVQELQKQVSAYEETFGKIRELPAHLQ